MAAEFHDTLDDIPPPQAAGVLDGHQPLLDDLIAAHAGGRMHHAVMLAGDRGVGKATLAYAFARAVLGASDAAAPARIAAGSHGSVHAVCRTRNDKGQFRTEITIADIHRMSHMLAHTADGGAMRVVIIDSAGDMNGSAANALLKNLEEPPKNTHFFLIVHSGERMLATIRSRCRVLRVPPLQDAAVVAVLQRLGLSREEASQAAAGAGGSVREALMLARNGGADLSAALERLAAGAFSPALALSLAQAVADREAEPQHDLLMAMIEKRLAARARAVAASGLPEAASLAALHADIAARRRVADAYNIDRKLEMFNLLRRVHPALAA